MPLELTAAVIVREEFGEAGGPGHPGSKDSGTQVKQGTGFGKEPQEWQKETNTAWLFSMFLNSWHPW